MELDSLSFIIGMVAGGGFFGFGLTVGMLMNRDTFTRQVKDEPFDPDAEVADEAFFEESWSGGEDSPVDAHLEELHRHSSHE